MKKASSTSSPDKGKKKKQRTPCLGYFGFVGMQIVQGKEHKRKIEGGKKLETCFCIGCNNVFKTEQGRDNHERTCALVQRYYKEKCELEKDSNNAIETSCVTSTYSIFKINLLGRYFFKFS